VSCCGGYTTGNPMLGCFTIDSGMLLYSLDVCSSGFQLCELFSDDDPGYYPLSLFSVLFALCRWDYHMQMFFGSFYIMLLHEFFLPFPSQNGRVYPPSRLEQKVRGLEGNKKSMYCLVETHLSAKCHSLVAPMFG
jgi:hypothetical protein